MGKRLLMLSHLDFIYASYFFYYPNIQRYLNLIFLQFVINCGYFKLWGICELSTFLMHIFWGVVIIFYGKNYINTFYISLDYENYVLLFFLIPYYCIKDYVYTERHYLCDNP